MLQWPQGSVAVQGADNGLVFDFYLNKTRPEQMFDPSLFRTMNISFQGAHGALPAECVRSGCLHCCRGCTSSQAECAGAEPIVKGLHTYQYGVASESNQSCAQQIAQRAALQAASTRRNRTAPPLDFGTCVSMS